MKEREHKILHFLSEQGLGKEIPIGKICNWFTKMKPEDIAYSLGVLDQMGCVVVGRSPHGKIKRAYITEVGMKMFVTVARSQGQGTPGTIEQIDEIRVALTELQQIVKELQDASPAKRKSLLDLDRINKLMEIITKIPKVITDIHGLIDYIR